MIESIAILLQTVFAFLAVGAIVFMIHLFLEWLEGVIPALPFWTMIPAVLFGGAFIFMITGNTDWNYFWTIQLSFAIIIITIELVSRRKK